jgi:hypothetical protein
MSEPKTPTSAPKTNPKPEATPKTQPPHTEVIIFLYDNPENHKKITLKTNTKPNQQNSQPPTYPPTVFIRKKLTLLHYPYDKT